MLSPAELEDAIGRFTYWPGWRFRAYHDEHLGPMLLIVTRQPDRDDPEHAAVDLGIRVRIPPHALAGVRELGTWLAWRLEEAAIHEVREGLRYDGELVDDPHAS